MDQIFLSDQMDFMVYEFVWNKDQRKVCFKFMVIRVEGVFILARIRTSKFSSCKSPFWKRKKKRFTLTVNVVYGEDGNDQSK